MQKKTYLITINLKQQEIGNQEQVPKTGSMSLRTDKRHFLISESHFLIRESRDVNNKKANSCSKVHKKIHIQILVSF